LKDGIDLLAKTQLPKELGWYLSEQYKLENISSAGANVLSEIRLTEDKLQSFIHSIKAHQKALTPKISNPNQYTLGLPEFAETIAAAPSYNDKSETIDLELIKEVLPKNLEQLKVDNSEFVPLVLCALVVRKLIGFESSFGVDVTQTINDYLVAEGNKKESTNVSRSLRSLKFKSLPWLMIRDDLHPKFKSFSLNDNWNEYWKDYFGEDPKL
jgi:hypothetical protein